MNFILEHDLLTKIKAAELNILLEESIIPDQEVEASIAAAEHEISGYISHRYDVALAMPPIWLLNYPDERQIGDLIIIFVENQFDLTTIYGTNSLAHWSNGRVYRSLVSANVGNDPTSSPSEWAYIGTNFKYYTSLIDGNDDDPVNSASWTELESDPRDALLKRMHVDLVLYDLHARIKPRQIPEHRIALRDDAIQFLRDAADPRKNITLNLALIDHGEQSGVDMTHGGNDKISHSY